MSGFVIFLILLIGVPLTLSYVLSAMAKQQKDILVGVPGDVAADAVRDAFRGMGWSETYGKGELNYRCRGWGLSSMAIKTKPVISVAFADAAPGVTQVSVWLSEWGSAWGQMGCCDRVVMKRRAVLKRLAELPSPHGASLPAGGPGITGPGPGQTSAAWQGHPAPGQGGITPTFGPPPQSPRH